MNMSDNDNLEGFSGNAGRKASFDVNSMVRENIKNLTIVILILCSGS